MKIRSLVKRTSTTGHKTIGIVLSKGNWVGWYVVYWFNTSQKNQYHEHSLEVLYEGQ